MKEKTEGIFIPKKILRHKKLLAGAKLLYGEIAFICKRDGCCTKRNAYFAKLYGTNVGTISRWIDSLKKNKLIKHILRHKYIRTIFLSTVDNETINKVVGRSTAPTYKTTNPIDRSTDTLKSIEHSSNALNNTSSFDNEFDFNDEDIDKWLDEINIK